MGNPQPSPSMPVVGGYVGKVHRLDGGRFMQRRSFWGGGSDHPLLLLLVCCLGLRYSQACPKGSGWEYRLSWFGCSGSGGLAMASGHVQVTGLVQPAPTLCCAACYCRRCADVQLFQGALADGECAITCSVRPSHVMPVTTAQVRASGISSSSSVWVCGHVRVMSCVA
jgi:hypothetical protein